jgi:hypothetical protein
MKESKEEQKLKKIRKATAEDNRMSWHISSEVDQCNEMFKDIKRRKKREKEEQVRRVIQKDK